MTCVSKYDKSWYRDFFSAEQKVEIVCVDLDIGTRGNLFALHNKKKKKWSSSRKPGRKRDENQRSKGEEGEGKRQEK